MHPTGQSDVPSVVLSKSQDGRKAACEAHPAGQLEVPSVDASKSQLGTTAAKYVHPDGHSAVPSVDASRSHTGVLTWSSSSRSDDQLELAATSEKLPETGLAVPVHEAGTSVAVPKHVSATISAVPSQLATACNRRPTVAADDDSEHVALFSQGLLAHSSTSISQFPAPAVNG